LPEGTQEFLVILAGIMSDESMRVLQNLLKGLEKPDDTEASWRASREDGLNFVKSCVALEATEVEVSFRMMVALINLALWDAE
jgi:hypothetical protein